MSQNIYYYQVVPIHQFYSDQMVNGSQINKDYAQIQQIHHGQQNDTQYDQSYIKDQKYETNDQKPNCFPIFNNHMYHYNPIQSRQVIPESAGVVYYPPQYIHLSSNQNYNYPFQYQQIIQQPKQQLLEKGLSVYNSQRTNYTNPITQTGESNEARYTKHKQFQSCQQQSEQQNYPSNFSDLNKTQFIQYKQMKYHQNCENSKNYEKQNFDDYHEKNNSEQEKKNNSDHRNYEQNYEQDQGYEQRIESSKKNVKIRMKKEQQCQNKGEESASLSQQNTTAQKLDSKEEYPQIQAQKVSSNQIKSFGKVNSLTSQKKMSTKILISCPQQNNKNEREKKELFQKKSGEEEEEEICIEVGNLNLQNKITFEKEYCQPKVKQKKQEQIKNFEQITQKNQSFRNKGQQQDRINSNNKDKDRINNDNYLLEVLEETGVKNEESNEISVNSQKESSQNFNVAPRIKKEAENDSKNLDVKLCVKRKLNSLTQVQNNSGEQQKIQIKNEASKKQTQKQNQASTSQTQTGVEQKDYEFSCNQDTRKKKKMNDFQQEERNGESFNELNQNKVSLQIQPQNEQQSELQGVNTEYWYSNINQLIPQKISVSKWSSQNQDSLKNSYNQKVSHQGSKQISQKIDDELQNKQSNDSKQQPVLQSNKEFSRNQLSKLNYSDIKQQNKQNDGANEKDISLSSKYIFSQQIKNCQNQDSFPPNYCQRVLQDNLDESKFQQSNIPNQSIQFYSKSMKQCEEQQISINKENTIQTSNNLSSKNFLIATNQKENQLEQLSENALEIDIQDSDSQCDNSQEFLEGQSPKSSLEKDKIQMNKVAIGNASKNILKAFQKYIASHASTSNCTISSLNRMYQRNTLSNLLMIKIYLNPSYNKLMNEFIDLYAQNWLIQSKVQNLDIHLKILEELKNNNVSILKTKKKKYQRKKITEFNNQLSTKQIKTQLQSSTIEEN